MKRVLGIIFGFLLLLACNNSTHTYEKNTDWERNKLYGKPKEVKVLKKNLVEGEPFYNLVLLTEKYEFAEFGGLVKKEKFSIPDSPDKVETVEYTSFNKRAKTEINDMIFLKHTIETYNYDNEQRLTSQKLIDKRAGNSYTSVKYDSLSRIIEVKSIFDSTVNAGTLTKYAYKGISDELYESVMFYAISDTSEPRLIEETTYIFTGFGKISETTKLNHIYNTSSTKYFSYNEQNNVSEEKLMQKDLLSSVKKIDDHGNVVHHSVFVDGSLEEETKYEYSYDKYGNWISRLTFKSHRDDEGKISFKVNYKHIRNIDYY